MDHKMFGTDKVGRSKDEVVGRNLYVKDGGMLPMDENLIDHLDIN